LSDTPHPHAEIIRTWQLTPTALLEGGYHNLHWLVATPSWTELVLRRYKDDHFADLDYEFEVMRLLHGRGLPVPELVEHPLDCDGTTWCLFTRLPGASYTAVTVEEQRCRGRLLAEFHETSKQLTHLGQRQGWVVPDERICDPALLAAIRRYEAVRPDDGYLLRWHLERAVERLGAIDLEGAEKFVLHSDFVGRNLLFLDNELSGIVDFEATHLSVRATEFLLSWRGCYDDVIHGYEEIQKLDELDWQLLVPAFWSWLFIGMKAWIDNATTDQLRQQEFTWPIKMLLRRSELFADLSEPYPGRPGR
jgi:aminoglycoside phosphotransferase (APT) family kinase protein